MTQIHELGALELGKKIADREISAPEAVRHALGRMDLLDSTVNALITISGRSAYQQAKAIQKRLDAGEKLPPLAGVPLAVQDNISTKDILTTCASRMLHNYVPPFSATVIDRLVAAGGIVIGKTNLGEFAMDGTNETSHFGPVLNPWSTDHLAGGSGGGCAAAVAAGEVWYALGSDTGGSLRHSCSHCGLTGLKPTYGSVSRYGLVANASSLDQIGPVAKSAADCAAVMALIAGPDPKDSTTQPMEFKPEPVNLNGLVIGLPEECFLPDLQPEIGKAVQAAAHQLAVLGARIEPVALSLGEEAVAAYCLIAAAEASANLARFDGIQYGYRPADPKHDDLSDYYCHTRQQGFGAAARRWIMLGTLILSAGYYDRYYLQASKARRLVKENLQKALARCDLLLTPVAPSTAPRPGAGPDDLYNTCLANIFTVSANLSGFPALVLPCGLDHCNLPIGFQLIGSAFSDSLLLSVGTAYQEATAFHQLRPPHVGEKT